jgi:hypothetical protein
MALEYGLTNRLALDFDLTFVSSKYQGLRPHGPPDTGSFHPMFQDLHINLRYNALRGPLMVTPFVGITLPTHDYPLRGHSAVGRGFKEFLVGINVGRPMFRKAYVQVGYSFAMHKRFAGLNLNRSNVDCEVGWVASRLITLRFIALFQKTHGGFQFPEDIHDPANFEFHDRVARANFVQLGGGATFALNKRISILAAYAPVPIYARNTHGDKGIVIGLSWRFSRESSSGRIARSTSPSKLPTPGTGMF